MIKDKRWGRAQWDGAWAQFAAIVQGSNPHNPANGAYGKLVRCCQIAKGMGWDRSVVERGMRSLRPHVRWRSEWDSRVRDRWLSNAWEKASWRD